MLMSVAASSRGGGVAPCRAQCALVTGVDLYAEPQVRRLGALFADEHYIPVQAVWCIFRCLIQDYRTEESGLEGLESVW